MALRLEGVIAERAKKKEIERKTTFQKSEKSNLPEINTVKEIAALAGVSHDTVAKVKKINATAAPEVKAKLDSGEISINQAATIATLPADISLILACEKPFSS